MTAVTDRIAVRVMVTDAWDFVPLVVEPHTTIADLKREALERALRTPDVSTDAYQVKFRGAPVLDESMTVGQLGARPGSPFIVLPARRRPVR